MKKINVFVICLSSVLLIGSCKQNPKTHVVAKPLHLLSQDQMVKLIADMQLLEATVNLKNAQRQSLQKKDTLAYGDIFKKYNSSYREFQENFAFYSSKPEVLSKIYDEVIIELTRMQAEDDQRK
jgi:hypothetical protein